MNKSYIGTSKLVVEQCYDLNDDSRPRPWSKYSEQKVAPVKETVEKTKRKKDKSQLVDAILGDLKHDEKFKEFVKNVDSMKNSEQIIWNDTMKADDDDESEREEKPPKKSAKIAPTIAAPPKEEKTQGPRYLIKICGIPYSSKERDIRQFFSPIPVTHCRLIHNRKTNALSGVCWIELENEEDLRKAMLKQKSVLAIEKTGEHRYLELTSIVKNKHLSEVSKKDVQKPLKAYQPIDESIGETGELFVRNLSYRVTEEELEQLFSPFGQVTKIHMPIDTLSKQPKGFAHVTFMFPEHALRAFNQLDGHAFQGRLLHILPGKTQQQEETTDSSKNQVNQINCLESELSDSFFSLQNSTAVTTSSENNWNTLFLSPNVIAEIMAERYGVDKSSIATSSKKDESLAVRLAVGETQIVHETRQFLIDHGVQLDAFSQAVASSKRSKTIILAKNLPVKTRDEDLRILFEKHGKLERIILPPYGQCALIVFAHPQEARQAFKQLSYRKFKDNRPLYLEWAPGNALTTKMTKETAQVSGAWMKSITPKSSIKSVDRSRSSGKQPEHTPVLLSKLKGLST